MDEHHEHLKVLREAHQQRLRELEKQAAIFGVSTPPQITTEAENIRLKIADIDQQLEPKALSILPAPVADFVGRNIDQQLEPKALSILPAPVADFVGRNDEIARLIEKLSQGNETGTGVIIGIRGLGGMGKTQLALAVARQLIPIFPHDQVLIELQGASRNPLSPEQALQKIIHSFNPDRQLPNNLTELQQEYRALLTRNRAIILADDARDASQVKPLLPPASCSLLITSRQRFLLPGMVTFDLSMLPEDEAKRLLLTICSRIDHHATVLAKLCGYLPLALRVSAGLLANDDTRSLERYLTRLADERTKLAQLRDPDDPELDVEASLQLSYDALTSTTQDGLCQLSVFPASFKLSEAEAVVEPREGMVIEDLLGLLRRRCLLEWREASKRYVLHDLMRAFASSRLGDDSAVRLRFATFSFRIPSPFNQLIGREQQVDTVCALLRSPEVQLLTLKGPGGVGKTRLGMQAAQKMIDEFKHGAVFVSLGPIHNADTVTSTIAQAFSFSESTDQPLIERLMNLLHDKHILLFLDNFEHVLAATSVIDRILATAPRLKVLVTSRALLHVPGEHEFLVMPLTLPDLTQPQSLEKLIEYGAVRLFVERAQMRRNLTLTNENATVIAEICARLDGLPLAIELAASMIDIFSLQGLLARLNISFLRLANIGGRSSSADMKSVFDWSYDLLDVEEQILFRRMAVFADGCTIEAAKIVCNATGDLTLSISDGLFTLRDKSLLEEASNHILRFTMLGIIHEYAQERLVVSGEEEELRKRHASYYAALSKAALTQSSQPEQEIPLSQLEWEHKNLQQALRWAIEHGDQAKVPWLSQVLAKLSPAASRNVEPIARDDASRPYDQQAASKD